MRLNAPNFEPPLDSQVRSVLDARLMRNCDQPLAVALSGGGDSLALTLIAAAWAAHVERPLLVLTVDHRLQPQAAAWTRACAAVAKRLGAAFQALAWEGPKPRAGLPAAARQARHRLLANAARQADARVILMGHTADDLLEAAAMRAQGSTTPDPRQWAPSPVWPEGRDVFLLRPMLGVRRAALRDWLQARGERWIEDPANADPAAARARAKAAAADAPTPTLTEPPAIALAETCRFDAACGVHLARETLRQAPFEAVQAFIAMAAVCAGGGEKRPATDRLRRVGELLRGGSALTTTLGGARIEADDHEVRVLREPGEAGRSGLASLYLIPGVATVWDGRYEITTDRSGLHVDRSEGLARRFTAGQQMAMRNLVPKARMTLPVIVDGQEYGCPMLSPVEGVTIRPLVAHRLAAACGLIQREPA
ncbi:MAG: tRNA lysidine(34) synthetase TilS [Phenylobacterium sp.]